MFPAHTPQPRFDAAAAYDPIRHRIVIFGGYSLNYGGELQDTWEYDGVDWTAKSPATLPSDRAGAAMTFDANLGKLLMFGGATSDDSYGSLKNETWLLTGGRWQQLFPATSPTARGSASLGYDPVRDQAVLYGGFDATQAELDDTWLWDGQNWSCAANCP
jgi:hypothetical protein